MNEKSKFKILLIGFVFIIILIIVSAVIETNNQKKQMEKFDEYFASSTEKLIYFYKDGCYYCSLLEKAKKEVLDNNKIDYYYINSEKLNKNVLNKMLDKLGITEFGTPTLAVVKNNEVVKIQSGVFNLENDNIKDLATFITENNVADLSEFIANLESSEE